MQPIRFRGSSPTIRAVAKHKYVSWKGLSAGLWSGFLLAAAPAIAVTRTGNTTVTATVAVEASITVSSPTTLTQGGGAFAPFTGSTTLTFSIRTAKVGGSGSIVLQAAEFTPTGGPTIAAGDLTYTCGGTPSVGTPCSGTQTVSLAVTTPVIGSIGADQRAQNTTALVNWTLANSPLFSTGSYSAAVTFTVSSV